MNKNKIRSNNKTRQFSYKRHPHTRITHKEYDHETQYRGLKNTQKPIIYTVHILTDDKEKQTHIRKTRRYTFRTNIASLPSSDL